MKIIAKPIEVIAWFTKDGTPYPLRFKVEEEGGESRVIKVDKIHFQEKEKLAGNVMIIYRCQSTIGGFQRLYEIKYEMESCKWMLFKM